MSRGEGVPVAVLEEYLTRPVYHEYGHRRELDVDLAMRWVPYTDCGIDLTGRNYVTLRADHAASFARPCRRCYDVAAAPEPAKRKAERNIGKGLEQRAERSAKGQPWEGAVDWDALERQIGGES